MTAERDGETGLVRRTPNTAARIESIVLTGHGIPAIAVAGGSAVALGPGIVHMVGALPAEQAGIGLLAGAATAALAEAGFDAEGSPNRYTFGAMAFTGAAGVAAGPLIHALIPAASLAGVSWGAGAGGVVAGFVVAGATHSTFIGKGDHAKQVQVQSVVRRVPIAVAGAGVVGSVLAAIGHAHGADVSVLHAAVVMGAGGTLGPTVASRLHRRALPPAPPAAPRGPALTE